MTSERPSYIAQPSPDDPVVPRDSSTVVLARDGAGGLEVFMLERTISGDFLGGAYVFPGGTLEERDLDPALQALTDGPAADQMGAAMAIEPERAFGLVMCAIRETFEESGMLFARREDGSLVGHDRSLDAQRRAVHDGDLTLAALAKAESLRYAADLLHYYAHWVTPAAAPKRYTTRFFVAAFPGDAEQLLHDDIETTSSVWIRPAEAVERYQAGTLMIIFPTRVTLTQLSRFTSVADLAGSTEDKKIEQVMPALEIVDGRAKVRIPGDPVAYDP